MTIAEKKLKFKLGEFIAEFFYCPGSAGGSLPRLLLSQHPGSFIYVDRTHRNSKKIRNIG